MPHPFNRNDQYRKVRYKINNSTTNQGIWQIHAFAAYHRIPDLFSRHAFEDLDQHYRKIKRGIEPQNSMDGIEGSTFMSRNENFQKLQQYRQLGDENQRIVVNLQDVRNLDDDQLPMDSSISRIQHADLGPANEIPQQYIPLMDTSAVIRPRPTNGNVTDKASLEAKLVWESALQVSGAHPSNERCI